MKNVNIGIANLLVSSKLKEAHFNGTLLEESKKVTSDFLSVVKNSPYLQLEFNVFNSIEGKLIESEVLAKDYIDEQINLFEVYTIEEIDAERKKLMPFISEDSVPDNDKAKLYEAIDTLINETLELRENKDIDKMHDALVLVLEHVRTPRQSLLENVDVELINEDVLEIAVNKFNEKYASLDEGDRELLRTLVKANWREKKALLETYKTETLVILEGIDNHQDHIAKAIQKIKEMVYDKKNVDDNIIGLHEFKKELL